MNNPICYVRFLNADKRFKEDKKDFNSYKDAWEWVKENFDNPSQDFINYYKN